MGQEIRHDCIDLASSLGAGAPSPEIRKVIYTTNTIESLNMQIRKVIKSRGHFPSDESASKLIYLALKKLAKKWTIPILGWKATMNQFAIQYGE